MIISPIFRLCILQISAFFFFNLTALYANTDYEIGANRVFSDLSNTQEETYIQTTVPQAENSDTSLLEIGRIKALRDKVIKEGRLIDRLDQTWKLQYPVGISSSNGDYIIILENDEISPQGAFLNAVMSITLPNGKEIAFKANRIPLSADGGLSGVAELALLHSEKIEISPESKLWINGISPSGELKTKVQFDCQGFKALILDASVEFAEDKFKLEDKIKGTIIPGKVAANFVTTIQSFNDLIVSISLPPFQYTPLKGFGFEVKQATFDFSDLSNPTGALFPDNYVGIASLMDQPNLWRGVYIREAVIRLPSKFGDNTGGKNRTEILTENLIIDHYGLSGKFIAQYLIPIEKGNLGGWSYSLDKIEVSLLTGSLTHAGIEGKLNLPVMDSADFMNYTASIDFNGNFLFAASMPRDIHVPLFVAQMQIDESSMIIIEDRDNEFSVSARLNGKLSVNASLSSDGNTSKGFKVSDLTFQDMVISTASPYFKPGVWSLGEVGVSTANGFSLVFSDISSFEQGDDVGLKFTTTVKLSGDKYCASSTLKLIGTRYTVNTSGDLEKHKLKFKKVEFVDLYISIQDAAISLEGYLAIYKKDPVYGDGFAGMISANIIGKFGLTVKAMFGEVNNFKYWYADAFANLSGSPIPIFTGVSLYGIGGGAYQHMSQNIPAGVPFADPNAKVTNSPINYIPNNTVAFGFKATVAIGSSSPKGFNAMVTFEISFNTGGGIREIKFIGDGVLMANMDFQHPEQTDAPIRASVYLCMDFNNDTFHGSFKVYVNALGGTLKGINPGNLAGEMVMHFEPGNWYVHVGKPSCRIGLQMNILGMTIANGSYFMMGTQIEPMPPPPDRVMALLDLPLPENRNDGELLNARGFAFGTYFTISTGDLQLLIFYASFDMGIGFDVMLSDKGETYCVETGDKIGVNGWYAEGQMYAFVEGSIGIRIKVFTKKIDAEILAIGAACLLEAKLPNPFWTRGTVGGYYRLLGGRIKGNCKFQFELGKQCTLKTIEGEKGSAVEGLEVVAELSPSDGRTSIDVFSTPQVVFNYQINRSFTISDDPAVTEKFKVKLDYFNVKANNIALIGDYEWNSNGDVLVFNPRDILPGTTKVTLEAKVHFEQLVNSTWVTVQEDGQPITQIKTAVFETGEAPDYIPESNVAINYPMFDMLNFYKNEFSDGIVQLNWGQEYLFNVTKEWVQYGRFTPVAGGNPLYVNFNYDASAKKVNHGFPADLSNNTVYRFELVNLPASASTSIDANIVKKQATTNSSSGDITIESQSTEGERKDLQVKVIYTCYFRTSMYNTLAEKVQSISKSYSVPQAISSSVFNLNSLLVFPEPFDKYELEGNNGSSPLITMEAANGGTWLTQRQIPLIYDNYPIEPSVVITRRNISSLGLVPIKAVSIDMYDTQFRLLTDAEKASGIVNFSSMNTYMYYRLSPVTHADWQEILSRIALTDIVHPQKTRLLTEPYPSLMINSLYPVVLKYYSPVTKTPGSSGTINVSL